MPRKLTFEDPGIDWDVFGDAGDGRRLDELRRLVLHVLHSHHDGRRARVHAPADGPVHRQHLVGGRTSHEQAKETGASGGWGNLNGCELFTFS